MRKIVSILLVLCLLCGCSAASVGAVASAPPEKSESQIREENQEKIDNAKEAAASGADFWESVEPDIQELDESCVYWTPNGNSYHSTKDCVALMNSKEICSGTLREAFLAGKTDPCSKCVGD